MPLLGFIFGGRHLILSLFPQKYLVFKVPSLRVYIRRWLFNPISFATKIFKFSKCLSLDLYSMMVVFSNLFCFKLFKYSKCFSQDLYSTMVIQSYISYRKSIRVFKMPHSQDLYSSAAIYTIPSLWHRKYSSFQNASPSRFKFGRSHSMLSIFTQKYSIF